MLDPLDDGRGTHAAAHTQRDQRALLVLALQFVEHGTQENGTGGAHRVLHGAIASPLIGPDVRAIAAEKKQ